MSFGFLEGSRPWKLGILQYLRMRVLEEDGMKQAVLLRLIGKLLGVQSASYFSWWQCTPKRSLCATPLLKDVIASPWPLVPFFIMRKLIKHSYLTTFASSLVMLWYPFIPLKSSLAREVLRASANVPPLHVGVKLHGYTKKESLVLTGTHTLSSVCSWANHIPVTGPWIVYSGSLLDHSRPKFLISTSVPYLIDSHIKTFTLPLFSLSSVFLPLWTIPYCVVDAGNDPWPTPNSILSNWSQERTPAGCCHFLLPPDANRQ